MRFLYKVLCVLAVVAMVVPLLTRLPHEPLTASFHSKATTEEPEFAIVVCRDKNDSEKDATGFQRQLRQISVLLKSAASLTSETLIFNIVADSYATYETVTNLTASWPAAYRERVVFDEFKEVFYPPGAEDMMNMFRLCATERLFLAQTFEDKDAVVFLDTDTLFLMPPENLWRKVYEFNPHQVIGIAPCLYMYGPRFKKFPTYGSSGLNAGVLVMNLTRLRAFEGGWTENIMHILDKYKTKLSLADQDILNILFSNKTTAKHLYELGCEWNYREKLCSKGRNKCKRAQQLGVGLLHGAALTFVNDKEQKFQAVFDAWERHQLGESEKALLASLRTTLRRQKRSQGCSRLHFIDKILLQGLENTLRGRH
ncbi:glucoside xylosyltransferase 1-like isoform X1 [Scylla paramamosain]